jgi:hypothetical protein
VPDVPYARFAEMLDFVGIGVDTADRPALLEVVCVLADIFPKHDSVAKPKR